MPKLQYWYAQRLDDADCYSIVGKTKKAVAEQVERLTNDEHRIAYGKPEKRVIYYADAFDLMDILTNEGGGRGYPHSPPE